MPQDQQQGQWKASDIVFLAVALGATALVATVVIGSTVTIGGGTLLFFSPVLLFLSPVLIPAIIIFLVVAGGAIGTAIASALGIGAITWVYNYYTGHNPPGHEQADAVTGKIKEAAQFARGKTEDAVTYASGKAGEAYGGVQSRVAAVSNVVNDKVEKERK
eukprot:jgi/Mesen1/11056/ME000099S10500